MYAISMVEMPKVHELEHGECGGFGAMMAKKMRAIGILTPFLVLVTGIPPPTNLDDQPRKSTLASGLQNPAREHVST